MNRMKGVAFSIKKNREAYPGRNSFPSYSLPVMLSSSSRRRVFCFSVSRFGVSTTTVRIKSPFTPVLQAGNALPANAELCAGLSAFGNPLLYRLFQRRHVDFRAQGRLRKADRHFQKQVVAVALEQPVRLDRDGDVQVARRDRRACRARPRRA